MELVHVKELLGLTGYVRGGCSPVGMKKKYPTFLDETALLFEEIAVSAESVDTRCFCRRSFWPSSSGQSCWI